MDVAVVQIKRRTVTIASPAEHQALSVYDRRNFKCHSVATTTHSERPGRNPLPSTGFTVDNLRFNP